MSIDLKSSLLKAVNSCSNHAEFIHDKYYDLSEFGLQRDLDTLEGLLYDLYLFIESSFS